MSRSLFCVLAALGLTVPACAGQLTYQPVNPSFGGSPLNGPWLLSQATSQNIFTRKRQLADQMIQRLEQQQQQQQNSSGAASFSNIINSRLLAAVADRITNSIFGENAQQSGVFVVQGTTISFQQLGANVQITVNDGTTTSTVVVPTGL
ncbi:curli assembly protein CsgF [Methylobacterium sp. NEAU 140]|uniref:curli assembly protein CsgF n=1 Tax=Methylobacterium sp. NEAU 140 TaxID=3064945 RepID=UPI002732A5C2|nr:curli assembly protein CsgF [Methylobacterium sp. NEAU 140]MDP4023758.1 curli assembly protein CsgF [Methylobacterium sp. NEAU 140]